MTKLRWQWWLFPRHTVFVCLELFQNFFDSSHQLSVPALVRCNRVQFHFNIRRNTLILNRPVVISIHKSKMWNRHSSSINKMRIGENPDQSSPGSGTQKRSDSQLSKCIRQKITAGTRILVNHHQLWSMETCRRCSRHHSLPVNPVTKVLAVQNFNNVIGCLAPAVRSFINNQSL